LDVLKLEIRLAAIFASCLRTLLRDLPLGGRRARQLSLDQGRTVRCPNQVVSSFLGLLLLVT
jgi:hypothetical protein